MNNGRLYAMISGATSDIGTAIAVRLSKVYNLVLVVRDKAKAENIMKNCDPDADVKVIELDLAEPAEAEAAVKDLIRSEGITVSKYVHCAGMAKQIPVKIVKAEHFTEAFNVNAVSAAMIIKALMSRNNSKALDSCVLISSTAAIRGVKAFSVYGSTKAAMLGLMNNLAIELAPSVRVNTVSPGAVCTRATQEILDARKDEIQAKYPTGTGVPEDLTGAVEFLLSDDSRWITGQNIVIDGGRTIDGTD